MRRPPHLSQFTLVEKNAVPMYPLQGLSHDSAIAAAFAQPVGLPRCSQLYVRGWQYREYGHREAALRAFRELLIMGRQAGHQGWIGAAVQAITDLSTEPVLATLSESCAEATASPDLQTAAQCHRAAVLHTQGYWQQAVRAYQQVLACATQAGHALAMGRCLNGLGLIYLEQGQFALATTRLRAAVEVLSDLEVPIQSAIACHNLGLTYYQQGQYVPARVWLQRALNHWQTSEDSLGLALTLDYLGRVYTRQGQSWLALGSFEAATDVLNTLGVHQDIRYEAAALFTQIAYLCEQTQHISLAIAYWHEVLDLYQSFANTALRLIIWQRLSQLHQQAGHGAIARYYAQCLIHSGQN